MTCATCAHWSPKAAAQMAQHGFGLCAAAKEPWRYLPPQHTCARHTPASGSISAARATWLKRMDDKYTARAPKQAVGASKRESKGK